MNISQLLRGIAGSTQPVDAKALELKVGQVVRGIVLQLLAEQDAMVNIGGVPIRARLETPLQVGQMTLLQVQPESSSGQVMLKPLGSSHVPILETSLTELVKGLGLKDTEANRSLVQQLHTAAIPLNTKTIKAFQPIGNMAPSANIPQDQWTEAAIVAHKKGLPLKSEIIVPLQQAMFSKPLSQNLEQLQSSLQKFIQASPQLEENSVTLTIVRKLVETISGLSTGKTSNLPSAQPDQGGRTTESSARLTLRELSRGSVNEGTTHSIKQGAGTAAPVATPVVSAAPVAAMPLANPTAAANPVVPATPVSIPTTTVPATAPITAPIVTSVATPAITDSSEQGIRLTADSAAPSKAPTHEQLPQVTTQQEADPDVPWIKNLLKQLGVDYEHRTATIFTQASDLPDLDELQFRHESVKGLLLQLASADDMPSALKETMQQVVQQITGQQLLLGGERGSPFSLVTLFVPIQHENGTDTASVHIQSKRKQGGNLDADNCRLLFDLSMSTLGNTLVDVQVVNRIVSLLVHNDYPMIAKLLETLKPEIETAMKQIGFQFISMKHMPYPDSSLGQSSDTTPNTDTRSSVSTTYHSKPYKGVDFRI